MMPTTTTLPPASNPAWTAVELVVPDWFQAGVALNENGILRITVKPHNAEWAHGVKPDMRTVQTMAGAQNTFRVNRE